MTHHTARFATACAALMIVTACVTPKPPVQYDKPLNIATAQITDPGTEITAAEQAPEGLRLKVSEAITARNLTEDPVPFGAIAERFTEVRDSQRRMEELSSDAADDTDLVVLVETRAVFYSLLNGGYRWTVYAKISVWEPDAPAQAIVRSIDMPAILTYAHEKDAAAIDAVSDTIARKVGQLVDDHLSGRHPSTQPKAQGPKPKAQEEPKAQPAPKRDDESVYFILVDRFANGDPSNDVAVDTKDPSGWHGGDLKGVLDHVDDLHALGVRTIWLSPIFKTRTKDFMGHGAFHGYWIEDINAIDPRFGDEAMLRTLADALHAKGMRLLLDLVVNHVGYEAPIIKEHPDWFHTEGTIEDWNDPIQVVRREVHGLPDLAQENPAVYDHLLGAATRWIEDTHIDGFRLDAVKHVPLDFWGRYNKALRGLKGDLVLLGEMYDGSVKVVDTVHRKGRFTHMFDFPTAFALRDVFCTGRPPGRLAAILSNDRLYTDPHKLVTFLDNHDMPRIRSVCGGDLNKVKHALTAQIALRGAPSIYYGTEAGLSGKEEPHNRPDMVFDSKDAAGIKAHLTALLHLRQTEPALREGRTDLLKVEDKTMAFSRTLPQRAAIALVHTGDMARTLTLPTPFDRATLVDALTGAAVNNQVDLKPGQTRLLMATPTEGEDFAPFLDARPATRTVELSVEGVEIEAGDKLVMVGSGPEIGTWNPSGGVPLSANDDAWGARLELPAGLAFAFKMVIQTAAGDARWEPGEDRVLFVERGEGPMRLALTLRRG